MVQSENSSAASGSTPNPSILLALRLASHHDSDTERGMLARLQVDAVKRVQEGLPFSSGTVALYCLAMQASCADPSLTPAPGLKGGKKAMDLRKLLEKTEGRD
ncbi:transcobalamin-1-like [Huso huso]|uniref:Transcobalamin-1-like n=1 Tax=Huso huso TaxID=61971 RepID=A0ABR0YZ07_HUSHU